MHSALELCQGACLQGPGLRWPGVLPQQWGWMQACRSSGVGTHLHMPEAAAGDFMGVVEEEVALAAELHLHAWQWSSLVTLAALQVNTWKTAGCACC